MKLNFVGKNIEITDSLRDVTMKKFEKLDKFFTKDIEGKVVFSVVKNDRIFEATIYLPNSTILRAEESTNDMYTSIDVVLDRLERKIRKNKTKLEKKYRLQETIRFEKISDLKDEDEEEKKIVKVKNFDISIMSEQEAILQLELLNHDFFVFRNSKDDKVNLLYKRKDGHFGLIVVN